MFEVITTGKNLNYGKKGEKRLLNENRLLIAIKRGWIQESPIRYAGTTATTRTVSDGTEEELIPFRKIDLIETIKEQNFRLERLQRECAAVLKVNKKYLKMYEGR